MGEFTHSWNGTVLTITSDSGTSSCDLKGEKGDDGVRGAQGSGIASPEDIDNAVTDYLEEKYPDGFNNFEVDATLSIEGQPADAKATGDAIANISIDTATIIDLIYPVGSIYMTTDKNNPELKWEGTTWIAWGSGKVPVGVDASDSAFNTVERTGGSKEMQSHSHAFKPSGTLSSIVLSGTATEAKTGISLGSTSATGTISSVNATGTISETTSTMKTAGKHSHYLTWEKDGQSGTNTNRVYANGKGASLGTAPGTSEDGAHTHTMNAHTHTFTPTAHTHTFTPKTHTHTITENAHKHSVTVGAHSHTFTGTNGETEFTGSGYEGNLQPYITCYMWKRTA